MRSLGQKKGRCKSDWRNEGNGKELALKEADEHKQRCRLRRERRKVDVRRQGQPIAHVIGHKYYKADEL